MKWYLAALKKYAVFGGRARRKEYWCFFLFSVIISLVLGAIDGATGSVDEETGMGLLSSVYLFAILIPSIAVTVRRLHDTSLSGWWLFIGLIPLIGFIILLGSMLKDSEAGANKYGANPKGVAAQENKNRADQTDNDWGDRDTFNDWSSSSFDD